MISSCVPDVSEKVLGNPPAPQGFARLSSRTALDRLPDRTDSGLRLWLSALPPAFARGAWRVRWGQTASAACPAGSSRSSTPRAPAGTFPPSSISLHFDLAHNSCLRPWYCDSRMSEASQTRRKQRKKQQQPRQRPQRHRQTERPLFVETVKGLRLLFSATLEDAEDPFEQITSLGKALVELWVKPFLDFARRSRGTAPFLENRDLLGFALEQLSHRVQSVVHQDVPAPERLRAAVAILVSLSSLLVWILPHS